MRYTVGIDEVGRGPIAGPVAVGIFVYGNGFNEYEWEDVRDSKKHTERQRNKIYEYVCEKRNKGHVNFRVEMTEPKRIDAKGIAVAIQAALCKALKHLCIDTQESKLLLDGGLRAPEEFIHQETIVRGDERERAISFASIVAKVERDAIMKRFGEKYPDYGFENHKGYGTKKHFEAIEKHGLLPIHRKTFIHLPPHLS